MDWIYYIKRVLWCKGNLRGFEKNDSTVNFSNAIDKNLPFVL